MPRGKSTNSLKRTTENKNARSHILIVVEGTTEENYFLSLINDLKLPTTDIEVASADGGDPLIVIDKACKLVQDNNKKSKIGNTLKFELVFCVFDDDNKIEKFKQAISKAKENDFIPITSIPCFEVWFLLHYCYTTSPFNNYKQLLPKLEAEMRKKGILKQGEYYNKSDLELYKKLKIHQQDAVNHATRLEKDYPNEHGCNNPSTKVHTLVKKLQEQKEFK